MESEAPLRRPPKQARGERRIATILQAAAELFDEIGYDAATTILIARRADTAVGSLYDFFPNKEAIAQARAERFTADLRALFDPLLSEDLAHAPLDRTLDRLIDPLVQLIGTRAGFRALYLHAPQLGQQSAGQRAIEDLFTQRIAALLHARYPHAEATAIVRTAQVCIATVKALTALAIEGQAVDAAVIGALKTMLRAAIEAGCGE